ncbi:hypothetical protein [Bradyrhizobium sp. NBAIM01]|uniref:hypothetical protein n=1 Tax=Bradyrhizobium sp. NBAIM01 TaxID=2793818 RepID=UPI001CD6A69F|nr:hypothetical protein [Bradyrhizobium sp. NBAIM01]MCA1512170.1 hypothetical protein [Bradyrhizobium sp. NBAIM01]
MSTQTPPATSAEARTQIDGLIADADFSQRLLAGDVAANQQWRDLHARLGSEDESAVDAAIAGIVPRIGDFVDSDSKRLAEGAAWMRSLGISVGTTREILKAEGYTAEEIKSIKAWKDRHMRDAEFSKKFLANDQEAVRLMTIANAAISIGIKGERKSF